VEIGPKNTILKSPFARVPTTIARTVADLAKASSARPKRGEARMVFKSCQERKAKTTMFECVEFNDDFSHASRPSSLSGRNVKKTESIMKRSLSVWK